MDFKGRKELEQFRQWRVTTVIDLRSAEEIARKPCALRGREGFYYHPSHWQEAACRIRRTMWQYSTLTWWFRGTRMKQVMKTIAAAWGSSTARRERTAPASPRLCSLSPLAGVAKADIVADYQVSYTYIQPLIEAMRGSPRSPPLLLDPFQPGIHGGFSWTRFQKTFGTVEEYLRGYRPHRGGRWKPCGAKPLRP